MKFMNIIFVFISLIIIFSGITTIVGTFFSGNPTPYEYTSIRGEKIEIYGNGIYRHMSVKMAVEGIAQDYVTLFFGIPLLIISIILTKKGSIKGMFLLAGTLSYFIITYFLYLTMTMYNIFYSIYTILFGLSFFTLFLFLLSFHNKFNFNKVRHLFRDKTPYKIPGFFLIITGSVIALLWTGSILSPLVDGSIYPAELDHYTTLIVQGMDLALFLPICIISGVLLLKNKNPGYLLGPVCCIFLTLLMTALTAKITGMGIHGYDVIPVIFIIPAFAVGALICSVLLLGNVETTGSV